MVQVITWEEATALDHAVLIDVRSEGEFQESHIPGAFNIPIFRNEERAQVGTVYKQVGKEEATQLGLEIASAKLPQLIREIRNRSCGRPVVIYCWRGGMRSKSISTIADLMGMETYRLDKGYRGYREYVANTIADYRVSGRCILIHGMTGTGKSALIKRLIAAGEPVIDLESCAAHKGSAFGGIGSEPHNQRTFDSLLLNQLKKIDGRPYFFMESKSQRIGRARIPDVLWNKKFDAVHILLEASVPTRVDRLLQRYVIDDPDLTTKLRNSYSTIESKLSPDDRKEGSAAIDERRYADLAAMLLVRYYDPRYLHARDKYPGPVINLSAENLDDCAKQIIEIAQTRARPVHTLGK